MRRGADIQITRMMLRKIRNNTEDTEKLEVSLRTLLKYRKTNADFLRESKGLNTLVLTAKHHKDDPVILKLTISILTSSLTETVKAVDASKSAWHMCKDYIHDDLIKIIINERYLLEDCEMVQGAIHLLALIALIANYWLRSDDLNIESFKSECSEKRMHLAAISAMLAYKDNEEICDAGVYLIYWLQCAEDGCVQRTMWSQTLRIAIDAGLDEFDRKFEWSDEEEMQNFLDIPSVLSAFRQDPIMGVLRNTWEQHKDFNQNIANCGESVQFCVTTRHRRDCKLLKCSNCEKNLPKKKERLLCSSCRLVIYCSSRCQKKHWKKEHKLKCKCKQATDSIRQ
mmetsp:Transcript_46755/g.54640  ORF Transcript_46755/g.54640 Transcript_46755/m.54640 type:complete len:340 (-) Transcript_46755:270-1289(-)